MTRAFVSYPLSDLAFFPPQGYKYFGFDPETLCHFKSISEDGPHNMEPVATLRPPHFLPNLDQQAGGAAQGPPVVIPKSEDGSAAGFIPPTSSTVASAASAAIAAALASVTPSQSSPN